MPHYTPVKAFSLVELLVALFVLGIVAAVVVTKYLSVQNAANDTVAKQMESQLNAIYADWKADGGIAVATPASIIDVLSLLKTPVGVNAQLPALPRPATIKDGGSSNQVRLDLPADFDLTTATGSTTAVQSPTFLISFDGADNFSVINKAAISGAASWQLVFDSGPSPIVSLVSSAAVGYGLTIYPNGTSKSAYSYYNGNNYRVDYSGSFQVGGVFFKIYQLTN